MAAGEALFVLLKRNLKMNPFDEERWRELLNQGECRTMPVLRDGQLVGLLTMENVGEFVMIESALRTQDLKNSSPNMRA